MQRNLEFAREGGIVAQVSMNGWMFLKQYAGLRQALLGQHSLRTIVDLLWCAFEQMRHNTVAMVCFARGPSLDTKSIGLLPSPRDERDESLAALQRKRAALLGQVGRHEFDPQALRVVPDWPLVFWWSPAFLQAYAQSEKIGECGEVRQGMATAANARFLRRPWEVHYRPPPRLDSQQSNEDPIYEGWAAYIKGSAGIAWIEPLQDLIAWRDDGRENRLLAGSTAGKNREYYFRPGVAFSKIGAHFNARLHRYPSIFDVAGSSVFVADVDRAVTVMNSRLARTILRDLNPTVNFQVGDVVRLPMPPLVGCDRIVATLDEAFTLHERHREPSVEFRRPGPSPWRGAQAWAQRAVDRPDAAPLPDYAIELEPEPASDHLSFALGVALGRFDPTGELGILDPRSAELGHALADGILFLDGTLDHLTERERGQDSLAQPAAAPLHAAWSEHGPALTRKRKRLRTYLRLDFFAEVHRPMYENRAIHWPLSSRNRTFVAWVNLHRWHANTLARLLGEHLQPTLRGLEDALTSLGDAELEARRDELAEFIADVQQCAERGPPPVDGETPPRTRDAPYAPELADGVMINAASLWPLLQPQWKDPAKWWKELARAEGRKDHDWSRLAARYFPERVAAKCEREPSLALAHGCLREYHLELARRSPEERGG